MLLSNLVQAVAAMFEWSLSGIRLSGRGGSSFTVKKLECSKQAYAVEYISME